MKSEKPPKKSGIYKIQSTLLPDMCYIGSARNFRTRYNKHFLDLRKGTHHSVLLQNHYNKYGITDLIFLIIEECSIPNLKEREQFYLDNLFPLFNISKSATGCEGVIPSLETRKKQSKAKLGSVPWNKGMKGVYKTGIKRIPSKETRDKISAGLRRYFIEHPEGREHLSNMYKGKKLKKETINKLIKAHTGRKISPETGAKISMALKGRKYPNRHYTHHFSKGHIPWNKGKRGYKLKSIGAQSAGAKRGWEKRRANKKLQQCA